MNPTLTYLYLLNAALLLTHEIDSAYWEEWNLFGLPGGIQLFLGLNFLLALLVLYGLVLLANGKRSGSWFSLLVSAAGIFAFSIHTYFLLSGRPGFNLPGSLVLLAAILVVSLCQGALTLKAMR